MKEDSASFALLKRYLLGQLAEPQMREIEERYLAEEEFFKELLQVESELIDQYTSGQLPPEERKQFEAYFLSSIERRKRVEAQTKPIAKTTRHRFTNWWRRWWELLSFKR